ncbi:hypothetical protein NEAUS03_1832 [Nematocida ausubeli]|nr:hypothetical protein NEAUS03_1832 [Nematocida ausubeli]
MKKSLRECFKTKASAVFGEFSRNAYLREVVKYITDRYAKKKYSERQAPQPPQKKTRLSSFENFTETTSINKCTLCVVVPNKGLIAEIVARLMAKKSILGEDIKAEKYAIIGDEDDDFMMPLMYAEGEFKEAYNSQADVILATTKAMVTLGDQKLDRSKYFIQTAEELVDFARKAKNDLNIYSFLSGVDTVIVLDADILLIQNSVSFYETLKILEEARPAIRPQMNLRYLSSGEEKKAFVFLAGVISPALVSLIEKKPGHMIVSKKESAEPASSEMLKSTPACYPYSVCLKLNKTVATEKYADHHITTLLNSYERTLVIVKDSVEMEKIKAEIHNSSGFAEKNIFFIDEFTAESKIKEEIKSKILRKVWIITERFIFYRKKRLSRILTPYSPIKIFAPYVVNPRILQLAISKTEDLEETENGLYNAPITLVISSEEERYFVNDLFGQQVSISKLFEYSDETTINVPEK